MFGQAKPFSFGASSFGAPAAATQQATLFGQPAATVTQNSMFGGTAFGAAATTTHGTTVKFNPPLATDTIQKNGQKIQVNTKHVCITAMKEYQEKSLEELRVEDYLQNRKSGSATTSLFGTASVANTLGFGAATTSATPLFGAAAPATQSSLFGATTNAGASLFGTSQPMNSFGQNPQSSMFGNKPLFGAKTSAPALNLGQQQPAQTGFGFSQPAQNSLFGAKPAFGSTPTTAAGFSIFGSQPVASQAGGFTFGKPQATGIFGAPTTTLTNSLFGTPQPAAQSSPFGQPAASQSGGIFGANPASASLFRTTTTSVAVPAFSGFGNAFGAKTTGSSSLFGGNQATGTTGFGLGAPASGTAQPALGNLFCAKKPSPFGTPTSTTGFGFGAATQPTTNLFGATTGFGLGAASQPTQPLTNIFGQNTATLGGIFNKPATTGFGFSNTNATAPSIFGNTAASGTGLPAPSLFGGTGLGATQSIGFGASLGGSAFGASNNQAALGPLVEQLSQNARAQQHVLEMVRSMPYGQSSLFRHLAADPVASSSGPVSTLSNSSSSKNGTPVLSGSAAASTLAEIHKANTLSAGRCAGHMGSSLNSRRPGMPLNRRQLFTGFHEDDALISAQSPAPSDLKSIGANGRGSSASARSSVGLDNRFFVRREAWKRLNIPNSIRTSTIERSSLVTSQLEQEVSDSAADVRGAVGSVCSKVGSAAKPGNTGSGDAAAVSRPFVQFMDSPSAAPTPLVSRRTTGNERLERSEQLECAASPDVRSQYPSSTMGEISDAGNWTLPPDVTLNQTAMGVPEDDSNISDDDDNLDRPTSTSNKAGIRLAKPGYYIFPAIDELGGLIDEDGHCVVHDFVIGRQSYGHILFPGATDITGINFDEVVHIRRREVVVYPDESTKPPLGYGLNRKAEVTLDGVWPTDKSTREFIKSPQRLATIRFDERLEKATQRMGATFIEYRADTGSWVFEVKHFSKYRLDDSDDEGDTAVTATTASEVPRHPLNIPAAMESSPGDDNAGDGDTRLSPNAVGSVSKPRGPIHTESKDTFLPSPIATPARTLRGVHDSLFLVDDVMENEEQEEDDDGGGGGLCGGFLRRRSRGGASTQVQPRPWNSSCLMGPADTKMNGATLVGTFDNDVLASKAHSFRDGNENGAMAEFDVKLEVLQSVHNPIPLTSQRSRADDRVSDFKVPYERIAKLCGAGQTVNGLRGCHFDATLSRGDSCRISWGMVRDDSSQGYAQQKMLISDLGDDAVGSMIAFIPPSPHSADEDDQILLNAALQTSSQGLDTTIVGTSCPQFSPHTGPGVLAAYLACTGASGDRSSAAPTARATALRRALLACQALWAAHEEDADAPGLHEGFAATRGASGMSVKDASFDDDVNSTVGRLSGNQSKHHSYASFCMKNLARRQAVSEWIRAELRPELDYRLKELGLTCFLKANTDGDKSVWSQSGRVFPVSLEVFSAGIFVAMCCGEPVVACRLALASRMSHLAGCLSMVPVSDPLCKRGLQKQLLVWNELKVLSFMPRNILCTYGLLAGEIRIPMTSKETDLDGKSKMEMLNVLSGLPYLQALGIHLWYLVDHSADLETALKLFARNWHALKLEVAPPRPLCDAELLRDNEVREKEATLSCEPDATARTNSRDVCYHLMRLASRRWHSLERTLDPFSIRKCHSNDPGDWPSAWHLWRTLASLGMTSLNPVATSRLHSEFAGYLEGLGLWEWAIFVLLNETDARVRSAIVKCVLARRVSLQRPLREKLIGWRLDAEAVSSNFSIAEVFVVERLGIPVKWIHEAKACLARSLLTTQSASANRESRQLLASLEAAHWLAAGHLEAAHIVYMQDLLPELVLHSNTVSLSFLINTNGWLNTESARDMADLATKLLAVLQPFVDVPSESLPDAFDMGAGVYLVYGRILHLAHQLALCNANRNDDDAMNTDVDGEECTFELCGDILEELQTSTQQLVDLLQSMPTPSTRERVIKSEMALTAVRLVSTFFQNPSPIAATLDESALTDGINTDSASQLLCQRLNLIANIGLSSEVKLAELETLSAVGMSQGLF